MKPIGIYRISNGYVTRCGEAYSHGEARTIAERLTYETNMEYTIDGLNDWPVIPLNKNHSSRSDSEFNNTISDQDRHEEPEDDMSRSDYESNDSISASIIKNEKVIEKNYTCPECSQDFPLEYDLHANKIIECPVCEKELKYIRGVIKKIVLGPKGAEYAKHEDRSIKIDRPCNKCQFYTSKYKVAITNLSKDLGYILAFIIITIITVFLSITPIIIWPQIFSWYKWISALILFAYIVFFVISYINHVIDTNDRCKKLNEDSKYCNPNQRCKHWTKKYNTINTY